MALDRGLNNMLLEMKMAVEVLHMQKMVAANKMDVAEASNMTVNTVQLTVVHSLTLHMQQNNNKETSFKIKSQPGIAKLNENFRNILFPYLQHKVAMGDRSTSNHYSNEKYDKKNDNSISENPFYKSDHHTHKYTKVDTKWSNYLKSP